MEKYSDIFYIASFFIISILLYMNTFGHYFLSDDFNGVYRIGNMSFSAIFKSFSCINIQLYRPFLNLFNKFNYLICRANPLGWNLINVFANFMNTVFLFYLLRHFIDRNSSFLISILFLTNFSHTEAVVWMSGRTSLLITMIFLASGILFVKFHDSKRQVLYIASILLFILGFFIKENIFVFPFLILLYLYLKKDNLKYSLPYFFILVLFLAIRIPFIIKLQSATIAIKPGLNLIKNIIYIFSAPVIPLNYAGIENKLATTGVFALVKQNPDILLLFLGLFFYIYSFIRDKNKFLILVTVSVILSLPVIFLPGSGERYVYLPSAAILTIFLILLNSTKKRILKYVIFSSLAIYFSIYTIISTKNWNRASYISKDVVEQSSVISKRIPNGSTLSLLNLPDSYRGAYVLRNGMDVILKYIDNKNFKICQKNKTGTYTIKFENGILRLSR